MGRSRGFVIQILVRSDNLVQNYWCACFEIKFLDRQEGLTMSSIICGHLWQWKIVSLECRRAWNSVRIKDSTWDQRLHNARQCLVPWPEARHTKVIWELPGDGQAPAQAVGLSSVCKNCMLLSETEEVPYRASSNIHQWHSRPCMKPTLTLQHTNTSPDWHLAPIKTIVQQHRLPWLPGIKCTGPKLTGSQH